MPTYIYTCANGHDLEEVREIDNRNERCPCKECGEDMTRNEALEIASQQLIPDIPEHWNRSMDCHVRGRTHLKRIQRTRGLSDYDPKEHNGPPTDWK